MKNDIETTIRECWFKDHIATLEQHGDLQILNWSKPGTGIYRVKFVFDGSRVYISGDLGSAIFELTWKATVESFQGIYLGYFFEKLAAFYRSRCQFNPEKAVEELFERYKENRRFGKEIDKEEMRELLDRAKCCNTCEEWAYEVINGQYHGFVHEIDSDAWEWVYEVGQEIRPQIKAYLIALKMAGEQLAKQ